MTNTRCLPLIGTLTLCSLLASHAAAQNLCATYENWLLHAPPGSGSAGPGCPLEGMCDDPATRDSYAPDSQTPIRWISVHFYVITAGEDRAAEESEVDAEMVKLNDEFLPWRIQFTHTMEFIDDPMFRTLIGFVSEAAEPMKDAYAEHSIRRCNVFVTGVAQVTSFGTFPWADDALEKQGGIVMAEAQFGGANQRVLVHEMGHTIGLWHTHHGREVPCGGCSEHPDGTDGDTTGDFCSDTWPTPNHDNQCADPPLGTLDPCTGVPWGPTQPENFMSYGALLLDSTCWTEFTVQQAARMHCWSEAELLTWTPLAGDLNGDFIVDFEDIVILLAAWGPCGVCLADFDQSGEVDFADMLVILENWT